MNHCTTFTAFLVARPAVITVLDGTTGVRLLTDVRKESLQSIDLITTMAGNHSDTKTALEKETQQQMRQTDALWSGPKLRSDVKSRSGEWTVQHNLNRGRPRHRIETRAATTCRQLMTTAEEPR